MFMHINSRDSSLRPSDTQAESLFRTGMNQIKSGLTVDKTRAVKNCQITVGTSALMGAHNVPNALIATKEREQGGKEEQGNIQINAL